MATNDITMVDAPNHRPNHRANGSPPPAQNPSKRDKRRQMLAERLATLSEKLSKDRDKMYREQLQKIQIDTNLVMRIDPYVERPLDEFEEDQRRQIQQLNGDVDPASRSILDMAGPRFSKWMEKLQDLVELRDYKLVKFKVSQTHSLPRVLATFFIHIRPYPVLTIRP